tara:strand:- start:400 stop:609 length:210 start_codon:yes stop_codon:yes gene_type:complete
VLKIEEIVNFSCKGKFPNGVCKLEVDIKIILSPTIKFKDIANSFPIIILFFPKEFNEPSIMPSFINSIF